MDQAFFGNVGFFSNSNQPIPYSKAKEDLPQNQQSARDQLAGFIGKYSPEIGMLAEEALAKMRSLLPGALELVYDNYNSLVIGFGPSERPSEEVFSIALYPRWVSLFFLQGANLSDPGKFIKGNGNQVLHIVLENAEPWINRGFSPSLPRPRSPLPNL